MKNLREQPYVFVAVPYPGVSPEDMETLVANPIEKKLKEITKVKKLTSGSMEGFTNITIEFSPDIEIDEAVRKVREKVDQAKPDLPKDIEEPVVQEFNFETQTSTVQSRWRKESCLLQVSTGSELQIAYPE